VEYFIPGVVQVPVREAEGMGFHQAMRAFLRSGPDVIMVGEIRDRAAMELCFQASLTGHLVLTTLHADDAVGALRRMLDMGCAAFLVGDAVRLVMAQRIVRAACPHCAEPQAPREELRTRAEQIARGSGLDWALLPQKFCRPVGCARCAGTGYRKRIGIYETLEVTAEITRALRGGASDAELKAIAVGQGMTTMVADGLREAAEGRTTLEEVFRVLALH
jgi:type II secretory ATPase GspE/PulE/Tfp pilus assembly ATPase PilB-like protein